MKKRVVAKAQKIRRRNRESFGKNVMTIKEVEKIKADLLAAMTTEQLRQRAVERAKEARDGQGAHKDT